MSSVSLEVQGIERLTAQLKRLADDKSKRAEVLLILKQIAKPTLQAAKSNVEDSKKKHIARGTVIHPGNLKKSIGFITGKNKENPTVYVGPRVKGSYKGWYGHFVHDGVNKYNKGFKRKKKGRGVNNWAAKDRTEGNPFLTKAYNQTNGVVTADADKRMTAFIQRRIDKLS